MVKVGGKAVQAKPLRSLLETHTGQAKIRSSVPAPERPEDTAFREPARWSGKELSRLE